MTLLQCTETPTLTRNLSSTSFRNEYVTHYCKWRKEICVGEWSGTSLMLRTSTWRNNIKWWLHHRDMNNRIWWGEIHPTETCSTFNMAYITFCMNASLKCCYETSPGLRIHTNVHYGLSNVTMARDEALHFINICNIVTKQVFNIQSQIKQTQLQLSKANLVVCRQAS